MIKIPLCCKNVANWNNEVRDKVILSFVVRSNQTTSKYVVARLFKDKNSIKIQSTPRNNQGSVCFGKGKSSGQVTKKAKSVHHF